MALHQAKNSPCTWHIPLYITNVFTKRKGKERKGRKTSTTTTPECSHSCNWNCAFCVSHEMNECSSLNGIPNAHFILTSSLCPGLLVPQVVIPFFLCLSVLINWNKSTMGRESFLSFACSRATTHVELQTSVAVNSQSIQTWLLTYFTTDERSHEPSSSSSWLGQWTQP